MELWIRSQDKEVLTKVSNLCYYTRKDVTDFISEEELNKDIQHVIWSPDGSILGYYATKKRALEILDEIQNILKPQILIRRNDDNDKVLLVALQKGVTQKIDMDFKELSTYVYEMPKE